MARSDLAVALIHAINRLTPDLNAYVREAKGSEESYARFELGRAASTCASFGPRFNVGGMDVLDVGCLLGGNQVFYSQLGAHVVVGADLLVDALRGAARTLPRLNPAAAKRTFFLAADARQLALADASFDVIVATNTFEHITGVERALRECARVLKPDGLMFISVPPYRSPWGAHLNDWIRFPWCQWLFTEASLMSAARQLERRHRFQERMPRPLRIDLTGPAIPHLNRLSTRQFEAIVGRSPLCVVERRYMPIGWRAGHPIRPVARWMTKWPMIRDGVTNQAVYVLRQRDGQRSAPQPSGNPQVEPAIG